MTIGYAIQASSGGQKRRGQKIDVAVSIKTAILAVFAFLVWWAATPGSWLTASKDVDPFYVAIALAVVVITLPWIAVAAKVEPLKKSKQD